MSGPTIHDVLAPYQEAYPTIAWGELAASLIEREEAMADVLRMAGQQYGLFPQIVSEVLAEIEMGEPRTTEQRAYIHSQWHALMQQIQRAQSGEGPMPTP